MKTFTVRDLREGTGELIRGAEEGKPLVPGGGRFALDHLLDAGKVPAMLLALDRACPVLVDERPARRVASQLGIPMIGMVGVLLAARQAGTVRALAPLLDALVAFGYRLSPELVQEASRRAGEA